jgi:translocator protein
MTNRSRLIRIQDLFGLALFVGACLAVGAIGGAITATSVGSWYQALAKPVFNPPDWVFGPVWTMLYVLMGIAGWRVWRRNDPARGRALALFGVQLALNLGWSVLFFGLRRIDLATAEIAVLFAAIVATAAAFWRIDRMAGALLVPYALWVGYASALTASIWRLNPG